MAYKQISFADWMGNHDKGAKPQEDNQEYNEFIDKFKPKLTTDDCYTPPNIYDAVADWVAEEYGLDRATFVRPFYPGGDYEAEDYPEGCTVVDNPPFSILAEICTFYIGRGIKFFLFAPALTMFSADNPEICNIAAGCSVTYENGAKVNTGFKTNLEDGIAVRTAPGLQKAVARAEKENTAGRELPKYRYPSHVITSAMVNRWGLYGIDYSVKRRDVLKIGALEAQAAEGKSIFGSGFLLSDEAAAQAAQAAKAAQAAQAAQVKEWELSARELWLIEQLNKRKDAD